MKNSLKSVETPEGRPNGSACFRTSVSSLVKRDKFVYNVKNSDSIEKRYWWIILRKPYIRRKIGILKQSHSAEKNPKGLKKPSVSAGYVKKEKMGALVENAVKFCKHMNKMQANL